VNAVPTVSVSGNVVTSVSVTENGTQVLTPSVAGGTWTVDDESVAEIVDNTLTGKSVNTTTATYTVNGCSVTINITVSEAPQEPIIMGPDGYKQGMCGGEEVPLQGSAKNVVKVYWTNYDGTVGEEIDCSATGEYEGTFTYKYEPPFQTENELIQYVTLTGVNAAGETAVQTFKIQRWFIVFEMDTYGTLTCKGAHDLKITLHNDGLRGDSQNYNIDNSYGNGTQYDIKNGDEFPLDHFVPTDRVGKRTVRVSGDDDPTTAPHRYCGQNLYFEYEVANVEIAEQNTWPASVVENGILTLNTKTVTANTYIPEGYSVVYQWQKSTDDGATWTNVGENSPSYSETFTESACYQVTATITDGTNALCDGSTIEKHCVEMTSIVKGDDKTFFVCPGDQITLEGYAENVTSATWSEASFNPATINNGTCVSNKIYVVPADFEGEKVITLSFEDAMSNRAVQTFTIKRNPDYQVTIDAPEEYYVCLNDNVQLQASTIDGAENERYVWNVTGQAGTAMNGKYRLNTASVGNTVISVTASADNYCPTTSAEVKVFVTDLLANIATDRTYICTDSEGTDGAETAINLTVTNAAGLSENITWYRNDVPVVGESGSTFTVSQVGTYYAVVATQDAAGNAVCEVRSNTLNITAVELKMGERQMPDPICAGQNISLEGRADNADANTTFSWKDSNGKDWGTAKRLVLPPQTATTPNEQTTYIFTATKGVCYATQEFVVTVRPYVELDINDNGITAICKDNKEGKTISVENAVPSNAHYSWQMNGREVATGDVFRLPATAAKSAQKVIVIGSADGYCDTQSETNSKYQFVYDVSDFTWNFDAPRTYCPGDEVNLGVNVNETGTSGSVFTYKWYENGAASASSSSSLQTYPEGDTEFYVVMSNGYCTYESAHVTVLETNVSVEVSDDFSVCPGDEAVVSLKPAEASAKINWTKTDSEGTRTIGSGVKVTDKPQQNTVYTATLSNKGCENKVEVYVTMWPVPSIDTVVTVDNPKMVEILSSGGTSPYDYAIDGEGPSDYQTGAIFNGVKLGRHTAYVKDENGCRTSYVFETEALPVEFPMYFTPNGDGLNDVWNPKNIDIFERVELVIYDRFGKEVFRTHDPLEGWDGLYL
ncbi:MAG: T9SS type B sorting domain-containing protein, partial [Bacteroidales bacterium]|nr:T9SS type B sorting domain-containing protein [Bacteroidales bacterium]